jgi:hypothetical protein
MEQKKVTKKKKGNPNFNRFPINPPKDWKTRTILPNTNYRAISR